MKSSHLIPDNVRYRAKWRIALDQLIRLGGNGVSFDWLTFDEYYGSKVPFLRLLGMIGQKFVAEVPKNFSVQASDRDVSQRADICQPGVNTTQWTRFRLARKTQADQVWLATSTRVWMADGWHRVTRPEILHHLAAVRRQQLRPRRKTGVEPEAVGQILQF